MDPTPDNGHLSSVSLANGSSVVSFCRVVRSSLAMWFVWQRSRWLRQVPFCCCATGSLSARPLPASRDSRIVGWRRMPPRFGRVAEHTRSNVSFLLYDGYWTRLQDFELENSARYWTPSGKTGCFPWSRSMRLPDSSIGSPNSKSKSDDEYRLTDRSHLVSRR